MSRIIFLRTISFHVMELNNFEMGKGAILLTLLIGADLFTLVTYELYNKHLLWLLIATLPFLSMVDWPM